MSTLVNLLLAIALNLLGVQVQEHVQENKETHNIQAEIISEEKTNDCITTDTIYTIDDQLAL